jgi:DNA invertase Pin-like site-specific DNA recombinase
MKREHFVKVVEESLWNAKAKGHCLGRPRVVVDKAAIITMRASGASWRTISKKLGIGLGTVHRNAQLRSKKPCGDFSNGSERFGETGERKSLVMD